GHSEGGLIAQMVASKSKDVDFIVLMAAPGVEIPQTMAEQNEALFKSAGFTEEQVSGYVTMYKKIMAGLLKATTREAAEKSTRKAIDDWKATTDAATVKAMSGIHDHDS